MDSRTYLLIKFVLLNFRLIFRRENIMGITAKELAKKLNLSAAAVSMALRGKPGVSTQTRQLVLDTALKYGYDFSRISEKANAGGSVFFIVFRKHGAVVADTPFFSELTEGISLECKNLGYKLQVRYIYEEDISPEQLDDIQYSDCSGIILLGTEMTEENIKPFLSLTAPMVLLDAYFDTITCDCILINNHQGAFQAAQYLIRKYKKQPGYLRSSYQISNFYERSTGFYNAVRAAGMSSSGCTVHYLSPSLEGAYADMVDIIQSKEKLAPCYFADNDLIAVGAMKAFLQFGYRIPEDIAVIGFDNMPISSAIEPALTTIHVPKQYMGEAAVQRLSALMKKPGLPPVKTQVSTSLIVRLSS